MNKQNAKRPWTYIWESIMCGIKVRSKCHCYDGISNELNFFLILKNKTNW